MHRRSLIAGLLVLVLATAGCSAFDDLAFEPGPRAASTVPAKATVFVHSALETSLDGEGLSCRLPVDSATVREYIAKPLADMGLFEKTELVDPDRRGDPRDIARAAGSDFLVQIAVSSHTISYKGRNSWFYPNLGIWFFTWIGAWWVPDEIFSADLAIDLTVLEAATGKEILKKTIAVDATQNLNDFNRGWTLFSLLNDSFDAENFSEAAWHLDRRLWTKMRPAILEVLAREVPGEIERRKWQPPTTSHALIVGMGDDGARKDAVRMVKFLKEKAAFPSSSIVLVTDDKATLAKGDPEKRIQETLQKWQDINFPGRDRCFFYFAGRGTAGPDGAPALVTGKEADDILPLSQVLDAMKDFGSSALVLDAGFQPKGGFRALRGRGVHKDKTLAILTAKSPVTVLAAAEIGQPAPMDSGRTGVLTRLLTKGISGRADMNRDGKVFFKEFAAYLASQYRGLRTITGTDTKHILHSLTTPWIPGLAEKKPPKKAPEKAPVKKPAKAPAKKPAKKAPAKAPAKKPAKKAPAKKPAKKAPAKKPAKKAPAKAPAKKPVKKAPAKAPAKKPVKKAPAKAPAKKPVKKDPAKAPAKKPAKKAPAKAPAKKPAKKAPAKAPAKKPAKKEPAKAPAKKPAKKAPAKAPAKKAPAKAPAKKPAEKAPAKEPAKDAGSDKK
jgi:hypothetical protein